jgi:predicted AlkP superfamily pyrophosphatase or phosphodiesterase
MNGLPRWVKQFNERCGIRQLKKIAWPLCYPKQDPAYDYPYIDNYDYAAYPFKMADRTDIAIDHSQESPFDLYLKTPAANQLILDFAHCCIKNVYKKLKHEKLLLWTCLSPLDLVGHRYGPDSREVIDMLYHLDGQLAHSMEKIERMLGSTNVSFVLTADHGIQPIPEISRLRGYKKAHRVMANSLIEKINTQVKAECGVDDFITHFESTYFIYNSDAVAQLEQNEGAFNQAQNIALSILREQPGIRQVWTYDELKEGSYTPFSAEQFYKNHIFKHRLGDLIVQPEPYSLVTNYPSGCSHNSSYKYDTNVVIGFYQKGIKPQLIKTRVATTQLAPTLAQMLDIPAPSSSMANPLPHILSGVEA